MKILVIIPFDEDGFHEGEKFSTIARETVIPNAQEYCSLHKYDLIFANPYGNKFERFPQWLKIAISIDKLSDYDLIWALDSDTLITNFTKKIEDYISPNEDFLLTSTDLSVKNINSGSMIFRNTPFTKKFLQEIWDCDWNNGSYQYFDQTRLIELLTKNPQYLLKGRIAPMRIMNSAMHYWFENSNWQHGDLLAHLFGCSNSFRTQKLKEMLAFVIKPDQNLKIEIWNQ